MYRIPESIDLSKAIGEFTTQILVGKFDIQFSFGDVSFSVQSPIVLLDDGIVIARWEENTWPEKGFIRIFNVPIENVEVPDDRTIVLVFESGMEMHLVDNSDQYECMQISIKGMSEPFIV